MEKGFTLIEILIAMAMSGVLMLAVYSTFKSQQDSYSAQDQVVEMQQNIRAGLDILVSELRMAGFDPGDATGAGLTVADQNEITFTFVTDADGVDNDNADGDNDSSTGADEPGEMTTIQYELYDAYGDGDNDLGRRIGGAINAVAENIEILEFEYLDGSGNITATLSKINSVRVTVLARANNPDRNFTNTMTYLSPTGAVLDLNGTAAGTGNPTNDAFRRRLQTVTVQCRNLGI